ncbi:uncharacterized protein [Temnothorax longispinosus]|uniref:PB1 domain-containing protein n=1 Tax=Temnothorax longispinosus TaxID=300112 RepID=A0A4S2JN31_9HYME|nr:Uncharacterized protein DBV15_08896 [Temnothorax longispinosus]
MPSSFNPALDSCCMGRTVSGDECRWDVSSTRDGALDLDHGRIHDRDLDNCVSSDSEDEWRFWQWRPKEPRVPWYRNLPSVTILSNVSSVPRLPSPRECESALSPSTSSTMFPTSINVDSEEYYCFRVRESIGEPGVENIVIPCSSNFDLEKLRTELWKQFGVPRARRISYIDDDGDDVPIDSECEFHEALKLAKKAFVANTAIPLIVGSFNVPMGSDDEQGSGTNEICCPNKESTSINDNPILSFTEKNGGSTSKPNPEFDKPKCPNQEILSNHEKLHVRQYVESGDEQTESKDVEIPQSNALLRCHSDTVPPPWFTEYMDAMKKEMVSTITHEVVKNVTEVLNKRLDSLAHPPLKELGQSRNQSYSSLSKRHSRGSFDSNEKNQKRMRSQDEEQSSDASIERVDEPQNVNTAEEPQTKKDMISTISQEVVKEMTEMLNRVTLDLTSVPSRKLGQSRSQSHLPSSKRFPRHFDSQSCEKNQRKKRSQNGEQSSGDASTERTYEPRNTSTANTSWQDKLLQKKFDLMEDRIAICTSKLKEEKKKKHHQRLAQVTTDSLNNDIGKEQSVQNNAREEFVPRKNLSSQVDSIPYDETPGIFENELRMSCSVTGHQILDEGRRPRDVWYCNNSDVDKTSFWSCDQDEDSDDAFEIVQIPVSGGRNESSTRPEEPAVEQRRHDSNRDSPSFELLSDPPSPTSFMHFNEEHFSANEGNAEQQSFANPPTSSIYVVDIHGKVYNKHQLADLDEHVSADLEKRPGGVYSFVTETLPVQDAPCSKSSCLRAEQRSIERKKNSRDDVCDTRDNASSTYDDVRNSHTSYLTVRTHCDLKTQCSCQSQTDSSDFTQSFHSHTTSVTDTTDIYTEAASGSGRYGEQQVPTTAKNVREAATTTTRNDHDVVDGCTEGLWTNEIYNGADNYSKCTCSSHSGTSRFSADSAYQSSQASGPSDRTSSNAGSRKTSVGGARQTSGTADPVHILPETLVTAAAHVGSYAYGTACEMLDKIRAHTREDSAKRRGGAKCDDKKRFFVGPLSLY